jgi:hypothetical protein
MPTADNDPPQPLMANGQIDADLIDVTRAVLDSAHVG